MNKNAKVKKNAEKTKKTLKQQTENVYHMNAENEGSHFQANQPEMRTLVMVT